MTLVTSNGSKATFEDHVRFSALFLQACKLVGSRWWCRFDGHEPHGTAYIGGLPRSSKGNGFNMFKPTFDILGVDLWDRPLRKCNLPTRKTKVPGLRLFSSIESNRFIYLNLIGGVGCFFFCGGVIYISITTLQESTRWRYHYIGADGF